MENKKFKTSYTMNLKNKKIYKYNKIIDKFFIAFLIVLSLLLILS